MIFFFKMEIKCKHISGEHTLNCFFHTYKVVDYFWDFYHMMNQNMDSNPCMGRVVAEEWTHKNRYGGYAWVVMLIHNFFKDRLWESHSHVGSIVHLFQ